MVRRLAALLLCAAAPAAAQRVVTSPAADSVAVTIYRDPGRSLGGEMDLKWLGGYALVTETRIVDLPAGPSVIRFEGVAGNILPVSAIVSGLPGRVPEKNYDARLISPGALVEAFLGRQVRIRRTSRATGRTVETEAILRSGPGGIVLQTSEGVEALRCTGMPESLVYPGVPADLSDKPTLAIQTDSPAPARATLRLSYLAGQFDWQANYVAQLAADGRTLDLFAWLTLANANDESFVAARTQAVAGKVDRVEGGDEEGPEPESPQISLQCWPAGTTSDIPLTTLTPPPPPEVYEMIGADIVVTGRLIRHPNLESFVPITSISAQQLELGDLKLYRIPEPVTVAANAQKQVALLSKSGIPIDRLNSAHVTAGYETEAPQPTGILLRTRNVAARKLGLPLPMGTLAIFETVGGRQMLTGQGAIDDSAVGQEVEIFVGESPSIFVEQRFAAKKEDRTARRADEDEKVGERSYRAGGRYEVEISNSTPHPALVEVRLPVQAGGRIRNPSRKLELKDGSSVWRTRVRANGRATLAYVYEYEPPSRREDEDEDEEN